MLSFYATPLQDRFRPIPVRSRRDGWTEARQRTFVAALRSGLPVTGAADAVGMSARSAYRLADRPGAASFRKAWASAQLLARVVQAPARPTVLYPHPYCRVRLQRWRGRVVHRHVLWNEAAVGRHLARYGNPYARDRIDRRLVSYLAAAECVDRLVNFATFRRADATTGRATAVTPPRPASAPRRWVFRAAPPWPPS